MGRRGRPYGEISLALIDAARGGACTGAALARRACVGYSVARFKVSYLVRVGALVVVTAARPRVYALPELQRREATPGADLAAIWPALRSSDRSQPGA